ncbi:serine hydrolase domain-containing protein [Sphingobacterium composti Ten et al. 2007 non Yoo et al. 2007]|uniref:serine hydrolase domain-containing protein n=1 Tax=Sphingobacterium composti TaxID=363260 RepID=UPI00135BEBE6|nr:serine hydrolase [Sphingobacterium composti Ten et al. 2007 non Yoo et al. 2007]
MILNIFKWLIGSLIVLITVVSLGLLFTGNGYILKAVRTVYLTGHTSAFLEDYKYFENRKIEKGTPQPWPQSVDYNKSSSTPVLDSIHLANKSIAYLIIKNDSIWFEKYYDGFNEKSLTNSFSMAKSITAALLGKALELGYIISLDEKVKTYLPELQGEYADELTIRDLATMRSGLEWDEKYYSPFSITTKAYFYKDISKAMLELPIKDKPNQKFKYQSGDTQLLGMVLAKALPVSLSEFLSEHFWKPMGAENDALWQFSPQDGVEKTYCCIASNARDFARFGKLYTQNGRWGDKQLLDSSYVQNSITPATPDSQNYGYSWWLNEYKGKKVFYMDGHLGQFVISIPADNILIVRLGHLHDKKNKQDPQGAFYQYIEQAYKMMGY